MKKLKNILIIFMIMFAITIFLGGCNSDIRSDNKQSNDKIGNYNEEELVKEEVQIDKNSIEYTGWLKTEGANLLNEKGEKIQLTGLSSHGIQWFSNIITYDNLKSLKETWNINVFRVAMYTDENANGYIVHPEESKAEVDRIVNYAKELDMYVIVDWHILYDNNPQKYKTEAIAFFDEMSKKYADVPNVIYEICNEPNGQDVQWNESVKPYAEEIIATIRANSPRALVIVGTPNWCKDLSSVANNPLNFESVVYSCHFYAGSHGKELQSQIDDCIRKNIPIFVSECGITDATGNGKIYSEEYKAWIKYLNERNISWIYWSFCNKDESSSVLRPDYVTNKPNEGNNVETKKTDDSGEQSNSESYIVEGKQNSVVDSEENQDKLLDINDYLSESGQIVKKLLVNKE